MATPPPMATHLGRTTYSQASAGVAKPYAETLIL
ncbi:MAG: hypothetical protein RL749_700 [Verrucomicrobiota bacterium]|jgi:hypothetical protein